MTDFILENDGSIKAIAEQALTNFQKEIDNLTARAYSWGCGLDEDHQEKGKISNIVKQLDNITEQLTQLRFG